MIDYPTAYQQATGQPAPPAATNLTPLFAAIAANQKLPPRGQQSVDAGFTAHTLSDPRENPAVYRYYQWVLTNCLTAHPVRELTAQLVGTAFVSANVFQTNLPQPVTLNPWQVAAMATIPLMAPKAVILENNGVFVWLHHRHPAWPLIDQAGNNFNAAYCQLLPQLVARGLTVTYLGDLDSPGIQIADRVQSLLPQVAAKDLFSLQSPQQVVEWLTLYGEGRVDARRTRQVTVQTPLLREELLAIHTLGNFVEQEQLIAAYEVKIERWLNE
ncbi:DUF2399 domain-containing protein [Levilactobacillus acidifarinae]|uniref:DUF2399 domain-containing protein n=1 Tax=Levilactobacillus acidifarinae DSM 19394 = JCM 15949 TaxID=1423715 RepID=A0A0R1LQS0_9LACO|nr:DUF2399 domain-containing protein [Levilactobacillus acidifarinae]KRK94586.1 hypothetical protein FD25_GL000556 [Levilactobacillus acidifarinae DSM 19394]GEO68338.1 hypothetical protein LAC03_02480 [Levilactobacillus acidifarinae]